MTVNLPGKLKDVLLRQAKEHLYLTLSDYCVGLAIWDIYSRQKHARTGPLMRMPQWAVEESVEELLTALGLPFEKAAIVPYRITVRVPTSLYPLVQRRKVEELYRSNSAYFIGLILFALDPSVPAGKGIPHHKLSPLMQQPKWLRDAVFKRFADDFGSPNRTWPNGIGDHVANLVSEQLQLRLKYPLR